MPERLCVFCFVTHVTLFTSADVHQIVHQRQHLSSFLLLLLQLLLMFVKLRLEGVRAPCVRSLPCAETTTHAVCPIVCLLFCWLWCKSWPLQKCQLFLSRRLFGQPHAYYHMISYQYFCAVKVACYVQPPCAVEYSYTVPVIHNDTSILSALA